MTIQNRVQKGVPTGGQFATTEKPESGVTLSDLARAEGDRYNALMEQAAAARSSATRLEIAAAVLDFTTEDGTPLRDVPGAYIETVDWREEPNDDGTYDLNLEGVRDADGNDIGNFMSAQFQVTDDDLELFESDRVEGEISVAKVLDWATKNTGESRTCERHGGTWGDDETCSDCTDEDGNPRPYTGAPSPMSLEGSQANAFKAAEEAGYGSMKVVYDAYLLSDMGDEFVGPLGTITPEDVDEHWNQFIGPAVDDLEGALIDRHGAYDDEDSFVGNEHSLEALRKSNPLMAEMYEVAWDRGSVHARAFLSLNPEEAGRDYDAFVKGHIAGLGEALRRRRS